MNKEPVDPQIQEQLKLIGEQIKKLRKNSNNPLPYKEFSEQEGLGLSKNSYHRIELAKENYSIISLLKVLNFHDVELSGFFNEAGL